MEEYEKRFLKEGEKDYIKFLKIRAIFFSIKRDNREQYVLIKLMKEIDLYKKTYPKSIYLPFLDSMFLKINLSLNFLDESISKLYNRLDKKEAALFYQVKIKDFLKNKYEIKEADTSWYIKIFE